MVAYLLLAGAIVSEVIGTMALKLSDGFSQPGWVALVAVGYLLAFYLLSQVLARGMAIGIAYGIWGACGVALTAVLGAWIFDDPLTLLMGAGIVLIVIGVLAVEMGSQHPNQTATDAP
mgnify:CR=1 FL=1